MSLAPTLAEAVAGTLPGGLVAVPVTPQDVPELTELLRACEQAALGRTTTNAGEISQDLGRPSCQWGRGALLVRRGTELVAAGFLYDELEEHHGVDVDPYVRPGDPQESHLVAALIRGLLAEGRRRAGALAADPSAPAPLAKAGCYVGDTALRSALLEAGFAEVRRFWRMRIDHDPASHEPSAGQRAPAELSGGYVLRPFRTSDDAEWHAIHELGQRSFAEHFDFAPMSFDRWRGNVTGPTEDTQQWLVVELDGRLAGFIRGSDRYASEGLGYIPTLGVDPAHRGRGLAGALLRARFADDAGRGRAATLLHVDAENTTGATRLYEAVGMHVEEEILAFHRPLLET
ncbi:MAG TPA: GNAT family N-acetyltransferase [Candidatus Nanopelagicales bacterium]